MHDYSLHPKIEYKRLPGKKIPVFWTLFLILFLVGIVFLPKKFIQRKNQERTLSAENPTNKEALPSSAPVKSTTVNELLTKIEAVLSSTTGTYSVYVYDLNKKQGFGVNEHTVMTAASVNKIPILATLYNLAGKGEIDLENDITLQNRDIQDYGTGIIRYDSPGTSYSLKTLARLMMEKSDNTAAYILGSQIIGLDKIQSFISVLGLTQTSIQDNKTSTTDMANLMIKIYKGEITNKALSAEMLDFMDKSDFEDRIPKGVPENIKVYHKTGDEIGKIHDVGIIDLPKHPYYLGILTIDMTDDTVTKNNLSQISKLVYEYMKNLD